MRVVATPIPAGSYGVRVWSDLPAGDELPEDKRQYSFACNLIHIDKVTCELAQAIGVFSDKTAYEIGRRAHELGYKTLTFSRPKGRNGTRWAKLIRTQDGLDYYKVDLGGYFK